MVPSPHSPFTIPHLHRGTNSESALPGRCRAAASLFCPVLQMPPPPSPAQAAGPVGLIHPALPAPWVPGGDTGHLLP